jgi:AraC-like DNA-binding protein
MEAARIPRQTILPPLGRPRWQMKENDQLDLIYLSWGARWMGNHPIAVARHEGWVYIVVSAGTPTVELCNGALSLSRGDVVIFHPDCAYGWRDLPGVACRPLCWLWRTPPAYSPLAPEPGAYTRFRVGDASLRRLTSINRQCQRDVARVGETAGVALRRTHLDLDLCLAESLNQTDKVNAEYLMSLAINYLYQNPALVKPVKGLSDYLQVSASTLRNLFQKHCGKSPLAMALEIRMEHAHKRLATPQVTAKEVAIELGYSHPNDFSRAYKRYFGQAFSRMKKVAHTTVPAKC